MRNYSGHVVFPGHKNVKEKVAAFGGSITSTNVWDHDGQDATLVHFESSMEDLYIHLHNALIKGIILDYGLRIAKSKEVIRKEKEEQAKDQARTGWREKLTGNLHRVIYNSEQDQLVSIEYDAGTFMVRQEAWKEFRKLSDTGVDDVLKELGVDPESGWK